MAQHFDVAVIGGGLAGSTAALAMARGGHTVAFIAPPSSQADGRTTALLMPAIALLTDLGVWPGISGEAAALRTMRIVDGSRRLLRAPAVSFHASEIDEPAFGYNIANGTLIEALNSAIGSELRITRFEAAAEHVYPALDPATLELADGTTLTATLIAAADGRNSVARQAAGIAARSWSYPQAALVLTFRHSKPHGGISTEFHTESGPFTQVPLPGDRSSLVWVLRPEEADSIAALDQQALNEAIETRMQSMLGKTEVDSAVQRFPLSGMVAEDFGKGVVALVGEAAHVFPPIGAQGLNLGMRDIGELSELAGDLSSRKAAEAVVRRYDRKRRLDVRTRTSAVDLLNRSLLSAFLPVQMARAATLSLLSAAGPLRIFAMREGVKPGSALRQFAGSLRKEIRR